MKYFKGLEEVHSKMLGKELVGHDVKESVPAAAAAPAAESSSNKKQKVVQGGDVKSNQDEKSDEAKTEETASQATKGKKRGRTGK